MDTHIDTVPFEIRERVLGVSTNPGKGGTGYRRDVEFKNDIKNWLGSSAGYQVLWKQLRREDSQHFQTPYANDHDVVPHRKIKGEGNVLVIGDTHIPFEHPKYLDFCKRVRDVWDCGTVVHIGDEVDNHASSYHESNPDGYSAGSEGDMAQERLNGWMAAFPEMSIIQGNHTALPRRKALSGGLSQRFVKSYREAWNAPYLWKWSVTAEVYGVYITHGIGNGGKNGALSLAVARGQSVVIGHSHCYGGVQFATQGRGGKMIFGINVGCGIDEHSYTMAYARDNRARPTLGCGVIMEGGWTANFIPIHTNANYSKKNKVG